MKRVATSGLGLLLGLALLGCADARRPLTAADTIAGVRTLETSLRVKEPIHVAAPHAVEYLLPVGEYRATSSDEAGVFYAAPKGLVEKAGFSKRSVAGGFYVADAPGKPWTRLFLYVERRDDRFEKLALPPSVLSSYGRLFSFAVQGEELE